MAGGRDTGSKDANLKVSATSCFSPTPFPEPLTPTECWANGLAPGLSVPRAHREWDSPCPPSQHLFSPNPNSESQTPLFPTAVDFLLMQIPHEEPHRNAKCAYLCATRYSSKRHGPVGGCRIPYELVGQRRY